MMMEDITNTAIMDKIESLKDLNLDILISYSNDILSMYVWLKIGKWCMITIKLVIFIYQQSNSRID